MTAYAFGTGRIEGDNGCKAVLHGVSLDFDQGLRTLSQDEKVRVALGDGELKITGTAQRIDMIEGEMPEFCQMFFKTTTSNFGVLKEVTIKLNNCRMDGNSFEAKPDRHGNVFTLSMEEQMNTELLKQVRFEDHRFLDTPANDNRTGSFPWMYALVVAGLIAACGFMWALFHAFAWALS